MLWAQEYTSHRLPYSNEEAVVYLEARFGHHISFLGKEDLSNVSGLSFSELDRKRLHNPVTCVNISDVSIDRNAWERLRAFERLEVLLIEDCKIAKTTHLDFSAFPRLDCLTVLGTRLSDCRASGIARLSRLLELDISVGGAAGAWLEGIGRLHQLEALHLSSTGTISDDAIECLGALKELHDLGLDNVRLTPKAMATLTRFPGLVYLALISAEVDHNALKGLAGLSHLKALSMDHSDIADSDLASISRCPNLLYLSLGHTRITDKGLLSLVGTKRLFRLCISATQISGAGLRAFLAAMPPTLRWEADDMKINEKELEDLRKAFPGKRDKKAEMDLGFFD